MARRSLDMSQLPPPTAGSVVASPTAPPCPAASKTSAVALVWLSEATPDTTIELAPLEWQSVLDHDHVPAPSAGAPAKESGRRTSILNDSGIDTTMTVMIVIAIALFGLGAFLSTIWPQVAGVGWWISALGLYIRDTAPRRILAENDKV